MKAFGKVMTVLSVIATLLAIFVVASPTLFGRGVDSLFWDVWGRIARGDHVNVTVDLEYVDADHVAHSVNISEIAVSESPLEGEETAELPAAVNGQGKARLLSANGSRIWHVTLDKSVSEQFPEGQTEIYFAVDAPEKQFVDLTVHMRVAEQDEGGVRVKAEALTRYRSEPDKDTKEFLSGKWGCEIALSPAKLDDGSQVKEPAAPVAEEKKSFFPVLPAGQTEDEGETGDTGDAETGDAQEGEGEAAAG